MKSPKLKIIDWYIIKKFIGTYFLTLLIVIIIIVIAGSPAVKEKISAVWNRIHSGSRKAVAGR